jgi:hypothetical protein
VELLAGTTVLDSKPMTIVMDPEVKLTAAARVAYNTVATDLHETQRRGQQVASALTALGMQLLTVQGKVKAATNVSDAVKAQVDALGKQFDSVRVKFGVAAAVAPGTGGGGRGGAGGAGGGGGRGGADPANVLGKVSSAKNNIIAFWESPSASTLKQAAEAKAGLPKAMAEANAVLASAAKVSAALKAADITLTVPAVAK